MKNLLSILFFLLLLSQAFYAQRERWDPQNLSVQTPIQVTYETGGVSDFVWSPDGNQFAYIATFNDTSRLYRVNVDGSNKIELTSNAFSNIDWKDNVIVFRANDPQAPPYYNILLKKINPDGSGMSTIIGPYWYDRVYLRSDANWILYERAPYGNWVAMRCDINGGNELEVSHNDLVQQVGWFGSNQILYSRGYDYYTPCGIYKVNFDGSGFVQLTPENLPNNATFISSPNTSKILYCDETGNSWDVWIMNADGSNKTQLTSDPAKDYISNTRDNIWSADGQSFYFVSERSGNGDVYRLNIDGSGLTQITSDDSLDFAPIPSPDGTKLAFISKRNGVQNIWVIQWGPVAYYPFTGNANDSSGNGHHGTPVNNPLLVNDRFGNSASAYEFNGIDQRIDLPSSIKITADLSISFWVQTAVVDNSSWPNARFIIDRDICFGARDWSVGLGQGGKVQFQTGTTNTDFILTSTVDVNDSIWHHIVVIRDSAGQGKKIYIDGQLNTSAQFDNQQFLNNSEPIYFAACVCDPVGHKYFPGAIDDIRMYNRPLTEEEIQQLFFEGGWIPVELTFFTASVNKNNVTLNWATATELNNQGFEVERQVGNRQSAVGKWEMIGFVPGSGTTTEPRSYSFIDNDITPGKYSYRLKQIDYDGTFEYSEEVEVEIKLQAPVEYALEQNYPNPFNPVTIIKYNLPAKNLVTLKVYNLLGEVVTTLVNEIKEAGSYQVEFDAGSLSSGIYFYTIKSGDYTQTKKMVLHK